jgi:hypothetical protein
MGRTLRRDLQRDDMDDFCLLCPTELGIGGTGGVPDSSATGGDCNEASLAVFSVATVGVRDTRTTLVDLTASFRSASLTCGGKSCP